MDVGDAVFAPPASDAGVTVRAYRRLGPLTGAVVVVLGASAVAQIGMTTLNVILETQFPGASETPETAGLLAGALMLMTALFVVARVALMCLGIPIWCVWHYRAAANLLELGRTGLSDSPGWHAGWWFVPVASLWKPYLAMEDLYRASNPELGNDDWQQVDPHALFPVWWACWIGGNILANLSPRLTVVALDAAASALYTVAAALYLTWVIQITRNQALLAARRLPPG